MYLIMKCPREIFFIRYEHKSLRNLYSNKQFNSSPEIRTLKEYYEIFKKFIKINVSLQSVLVSHVNFDDSDDNNHEVKDFLQNNCASYNLGALRNEIENMEIKNVVKNTLYRIPRFNLELYAFVYDKLVEFPKSDITYDTITTDNFFRNVYRMIKVKMHLHHPHITGEILGYVHDFCNWKVRENKTAFVIFANNFFGFDMFFLLKGFQATAWNTKDINIGGTHLTNINFTNIAGTLKHWSTLKYYQKSLGQLSATLSIDENLAAKKVAEQFIDQHDHFSEVSKYLGPQQKEKSLDIIADGKGIIPYKKTVDVNSTSLTPENGIFLKKVNFIATSNKNL